MYHAFSYFRLLDQKRVTGALPMRQRQKMLDESLKVFGMPNEKLGHLGHEDVDPVLLSMTLMFKD